MKSKTKLKVLLVISIIPIALLISTATLNIIWTNEISGVQSSSMSGSGYSYSWYYASSHNFFDITYRFDSVWFTHDNVATITWNAHNATHFYLNFTLDYTRTPSNYWLIGEVNRFGVNGTVSLQGQTYNMNANGVSTSSSVLIAYIQIPAMQKFIATVTINANNTHNSDLGDVTVAASTTFQVNIVNGASYESTMLISTAILVFSIIGIIVIGTLAVIIWRKSNKFAYHDYVSPVRL